MLERRPASLRIFLFSSTSRRSLEEILILSMGRECTPPKRLEFLIPSLPHWNLAQISWKVDDERLSSAANGKFLGRTEGTPEGRPMVDGCFVATRSETWSRQLTRSLIHNILIVDHFVMEI